MLLPHQQPGDLNPPHCRELPLLQPGDTANSGITFEFAIVPASSAGDRAAPNRRR